MRIGCQQIKFSCAPRRPNPESRIPNLETNPNFQMRKRKRRAEDYPPYLNATSYAGRARHSYARRLEACGFDD